MFHKSLISLSAAALILTFTGPLSAEGGKNAYNNPNGQPDDDDFSSPYANYDGDGRMLVSCADGEKLMMVSAGKEGVEIICQVTD